MVTAFPVFLRKPWLPRGFLGIPLPPPRGGSLGWARLTRGGGSGQEMTARGFQLCQGLRWGMEPLAVAAGDEPSDPRSSPVLPTLKPRFVGPVGQLRPACAQDFLWFSTWVSRRSPIQAQKLLLRGFASAHSGLGALKVF